MKPCASFLIAFAYQAAVHGQRAVEMLRRVAVLVVDAQDGERRILYLVRDSGIAEENLFSRDVSAEGGAQLSVTNRQRLFLLACGVFRFLPWREKGLGLCCQHECDGTSQGDYFTFVIFHNQKYSG